MIAPPSEDQVIKCLTLGGHFLLKPPHHAMVNTTWCCLEQARRQASGLAYEGL